MLGGATGCGADPRASGHTVDSVQETLNARAAALLNRDEQAYLAVIAAEQNELRTAERKLFRNLGNVPIGSWAYRLGTVRRDGNKVYAEAELGYRVRGYDTAPVVVPRRIELGLRDSRWFITADRPGEGAAEQLWQQGAVTVVRGRSSLILAVDRPMDRLRALADAVDRAVPAVSRAWRAPWPGRVVIMVPGSVEAMGGLLGTPPAAYRGIAAVTTGETGTSAAVPADRVIVNPVAYDSLGDVGRSVVLAHETTHVATRSATSAATPMWLSEGFADWVAYRGTPRTTGQNAPELQRAVQQGELPAVLPADHDFSFGGDQSTLARAYEGGWLACELIAARWGEDTLVRFYRQVGAGGDRTAAVTKAMHQLLGIGPEDFTVRWRDYLRDRLA
ncbi:hypothetical protein FQU76_07270 [Streptomyces qinzhouensis]|uniref:M1 family metallopeptidase n=1 Tax=Streptomyces qinzhouensis TaxID=2599401 RepID=A0A5B8JS15_9ACTN|nr:hypothetical protein FQU76_07270 [Streptomyces qinzhouensis]